MFEDTRALSGFTVNYVCEARRFYGESIGMGASEESEPMPHMLELNVAGGQEVPVYAKPGRVPASFTVLDFPVEDTVEAIDELAARGVCFERYEGAEQDEKGIFRGGAAPPIT